MATSDLVLNIAVNLGRMARWASEGNIKRVKQFAVDTNVYLQELEEVHKRQRFSQTFDLFKERYEVLCNDIRLDDDWAEEILTWANILTHRAKLA